MRQPGVIRERSDSSGELQAEGFGSLGGRASSSEATAHRSSVRRTGMSVQVGTYGTQGSALTLRRI